MEIFVDEYSFIRHQWYLDKRGKWQTRPVEITVSSYVRWQPAYKYRLFCRRCFEHFEHVQLPGRRREYCDECLPIVKREQARLRKRRQREREKNSGSAST